MQVSGTIKDSNATFCINATAKRVEGTIPTYRFQLKGLPARWNREYTRHLLTAWGRKHGFTAVNIIKTSEKELVWSGYVLFSVPNLSRDL